MFPQLLHETISSVHDCSFIASGIGQFLLMREVGFVFLQVLETQCPVVFLYFWVWP